METYVYPVDGNGKILKGFCPTICEEEESQGIAEKMICDLNRFNIKFDAIVIEDV